MTINIRQDFVARQMSTSKAGSKGMHQAFPIVFGKQIPAFKANKTALVGFP